MPQKGNVLKELVTRSMLMTVGTSRGREPS